MSEGAPSRPTHVPAVIDLTGRAVIVVGGAFGIGQAVAVLASEHGAAVTIGDIDDGGDRCAEALVAQGRDVEFARCDATDPTSVEELVERVCRRRGRIDGMVTTVGGAHPTPVVETDLDVWDAEIGFNLTSAFVVSRAVLPAMVEQGFGSIVLTSSAYGAKPGPGRAAYSAAKAGVIGFGRSMAAEVAEYGVRANVVAPGPTATPRFFDLLGEAQAEKIRAAVPLGRLNEPVDCAAAMVFLLSDHARQITGQVVHVNGGNFMP